MSILILNKLPAKLTNYKEWLKDYKDDIVLFTQNKHKNDYKGVSYVEGFDNYITNPLVDKRVLELYIEKQFDTIIALDESDIIRAGHLRTILNLQGQNYESAYVYRNKIAMKNRLHKYVNTQNIEKFLILMISITL